MLHHLARASWFVAHSDAIPLHLLHGNSVVRFGVLWVSCCVISGKNNWTINAVSKEWDPTPQIVPCNEMLRTLSATREHSWFMTRTVEGTTASACVQSLQTCVPIPEYLLDSNDARNKTVIFGYFRSSKNCCCAVQLTHVQNAVILVV
jgi:hypothetical protein